MTVDRLRPKWLFILGIVALLVQGCTAAGFDDDFANNLLTDLAPLLALFGERVTMQFMSQSTGWADNFLLAMAPLGIVTIIVSAIRVGGPSWLKAIIGRARENLAAAEVDIMSSTSPEVCELWNGSEIIRCMGSAPVREFICLVPKCRTEDSPNADDGSNIGNKTRVKWMDAKDAKDCGYLIPPEKTKDLEKADIPAEQKTNFGSSTRSPQISNGSEPQVIVVANTSTDDAPNISLNVHTQNRAEVRVAAIIGTVIQLGILIYASFATYHPRLKFPKEDKEAVSNYAFPCTATGTLLLVTGLLLCANVIESRTSEETLQIKNTHIAHTIWVQRTATVGDQVFGSSAIYARKHRTEFVTSRRLEPAKITYKLGILDNSIKAVASIHLTVKKILSNMKAETGSVTNATDNKMKGGDAELVRRSKTVIGTFISLTGYIVQFIGLRGMHWSVPVVQLGAVLAMTTMRALVRRGLVDPPQDKLLSPGFELDWLASTITDKDDGPWADESTYKKRWRVTTPDEPRFKRLDDESQQAQSKAQAILDLRSGLAKLAGWKGPAFSEANAIARAIEIVMKTIFPDSSRNKTFTWWLRASYDGSSKSDVELSLTLNNGNWTINRQDVEAALSLWLFSVCSQSQASTISAINNVFCATDRPNLRLLSPNTAELCRDLQWWMPRDLGKPIVVAKRVGNNKGPGLTVDGCRTVGLGSEPMQFENFLTTFDKKEFAKTQLDRDGNYYTKNSLLATESFIDMKSLYALDLFSSFMWAVAKTMREPVEGQAEVRPSAISGADAWKSFTLHNSRLATMANEIQNTGLADLAEVYASIIPPLSKENKLPQADGIIDSVREHLKPYERQGNVQKVTEDYLWLFETALTFPNKSPILKKATAVLIVYWIRLFQDLVFWQESDSAREWSVLVIDRQLQNHGIDTKEIVAGIMSLYKFQDRKWSFNLLPERVQESINGNNNYPDYFNITEVHLDILDRQRRNIWDVRMNEADIIGLTPLHYATLSGWTHGVEILMKMNADVDAHDLLGWTPLHYISLSKNKDIAKLIIGKDADTNAQTKDGLAPLHCAAIEGQQAIAKLLIRSGASIDIIDSRKMTPSMWAARRGHTEFLRYSIKNTNRRLRDISGRTLLHLAAQSGEAGVVKLCGNSDIGVRDQDGNIPLQLALVHGNEEVFKILWGEPNTDKGAVNKRGMTLFHSAARSGLVKAMHLMLEDGVNSNTRAYNGWTPIHSATESGKLQAVELLNNIGADINAVCDEGDTPLHLATKGGSSAMITLLTHLGANVRAHNLRGATPLHYAAQEGGEVAMKLLVMLDADINAQDKFHETPLHYAAREGNEEAISILMRQGADINAKDESGRTPAFHASESGYTRIVNLMEEYGAI